MRQRYADIPELALWADCGIVRQVLLGGLRRRYAAEDAAAGREDGAAIYRADFAFAWRSLFWADRADFDFGYDGQDATAAYLCAWRFGETAAPAVGLSLPRYVV